MNSSNKLQVKQELVAPDLGHHKSMINQSIIGFVITNTHVEAIFTISKLPGLTLLLASWMSWQDLTKFLLHLGSHGSHGKILIKILLR